MTPGMIQTIGMIAASLTTLCWLPQAWKIIRTRETRAISLWTQMAFTLGVLLWLVYGLYIGDVPVIAANAVTLILSSIILGLKLRYG